MSLRTLPVEKVREQPIRRVRGYTTPADQNLRAEDAVGR
jgi:hypothetical protein